MLWVRKRKYTILKPSEERRVEIPDGLWHKCSQCLNIALARDYEKNMKVCQKCGHHDQLSSSERIAYTFDPGSFVEDNSHLKPSDPLNFFDSKNIRTVLFPIRKRPA